jgi:RND superfamily putative drug exporter
VRESDAFPTDDEAGAESALPRRNLASRAAHWSANNRKRAIWGWLGFVVIAVLVGNAVAQDKIHGAEQFTGEAGRAEQALQDAGMRPNDESVVMQNTDLRAGDPAFQAAVRQGVSDLKGTEFVTDVASPYAEGGSISSDRHTVLIDFVIAGDDLEGVDHLDPSLATVDGIAADNPDYTVEQFGTVSTQQELNDIFASDLGKAELLSLPLTLLILVITFGSLVAAGVPLLLAISAVAAAMGLIAIPSQVWPVDNNLSSVILLIGLAVGVDYSLFYIRREREERARGRSPRGALEVAAATSGRAVLISGMTVIAAMAGMFLSGDKTFISFAEGTILVVAIAMFASVTVLPALLAWLGDRIDKGRIPFLARRRTSGESRIWSPIVSRVMRRPWLSIVLAAGALIALAIPALRLNLATSGPDDLPQDLELIRTYNLVRDAFPVEGVTADVVVTGDGVRSGEIGNDIDKLVRKAEASPGVLAGTSIDYNLDGSLAKVSIPTEGSGNNSVSQDALATIRDDVIPAAFGGTQGVTVDVSGDAAQSVDFRDQLVSRLPLIFAFVFALAFILLLVTFRSIVIPIKAIILNLLSIGAAYGILVLIFQDGNGESLLDFSSNGGVTSWLPLFLFVILFGLSMDYHVFILSRVREGYMRGMTTTEAVRHGISVTAGTVTSAAVVMVVVFLVFATLSFIDFKEMGIGLAVAVLIDATIVRGVLLPASMSILGDWNWYLPRWLEWLPRVGPGSDADMPAASPRSGRGGTRPAAT